MYKSHSWSINLGIIKHYHVTTLKVLAMFSVADKTAFCILSRTWVVFRSTSDRIVISVSFDQPPSTSMIILYWCISHPLYCSFSSHVKGSYFMVSSSLFFSRLLIHGQLISMVMTFLLSWFMHNPRIDPVGSHLLMNCIHRYIPPRFYLFWLVHRLWHHWRVLWWYFLKNILVT